MTYRNIKIDSYQGKDIEAEEIEIVERKGIGHPDSMADGVADSVSIALCSEYLKRFGTVMHHNTDETQIVAGKSKPTFGGGSIETPLYMLLVGRATNIVDGQEVPIGEVAIDAAKRYLDSAIMNLDVEKHVNFECMIGQGSSDLQNVFKKRHDIPGANDTSFGIGFAPFSETEKITLEAERFINSRDMKKEMPALGEDVKVMGLREQDNITLTICVAMVDKYVDGLDTYVNLKDELKDKLLDFTSKFTDRNVSVAINTGDTLDMGESGLFLTVAGTSAENGDDGSVGRGNRVSGLITPCRPMSMEAASGKNPINHIGKIYNILSFRIADKIVQEVHDAKQVHVKLLSQIGSPIDNPRVAAIDILPESGANFVDVEREAAAIADDMLANIKQVTDDIIHGKVTTF